MSFLLLKNLHIFLVANSYALFFLRGVWRMNESPVAQKRWVKIVPHVVDTLLLISAIALATSLHQYPIADDWLTAKISGLLFYIGFGYIALRNGTRKSVRIYTWLAAQISFAYIVLVAITQNPFPWQNLPM
jgi:uncharacterized membrane protein SirB2